MITGTQILLHLIGDYVLQSDWMASEKTKRAWPAFAHALVYSLPFLLLRPSTTAFAVILITHFLIDRYRLARFVCYAKNFLAPRSYWYKWEDCSASGYHHERPLWLAVWLMIAADNTLHILINGLALAYL